MIAQGPGAWPRWPPWPTAACWWRARTLQVKTSGSCQLMAAGETYVGVPSVGLPVQTLVVRPQTAPRPVLRVQL